MVHKVQANLRVFCGLSGWAGFDNYGTSVINLNDSMNIKGCNL